MVYNILLLVLYTCFQLMKFLLFSFSYMNENYSNEKNMKHVYKNTTPLPLLLNYI